MYFPATLFFLIPKNSPVIQRNFHELLLLETSFWIVKRPSLRGEIPLEPLKKQFFSILFWENENEASPDFLHILEGII